MMVAIPTSSRTAFSVSRVIAHPPAASDSRGDECRHHECRRRDRTANARPNMLVHREQFEIDCGADHQKDQARHSGSIVKLAATKASASEHSDKTTASSAMVTMPSTNAGELLVHPRRHDHTKRRRCCGADHQIRGRLQEIVPGRLGEDRPPRRVAIVQFRQLTSDPFGSADRAHANPMISAVRSDARHRAATICGCPGNATAVATSTTGLIAGAASMNVNAAAPTAPSPNRRRATGTEPHSQPGSAAPPTPAVRIAAAGLRGNHRASRSGVTNAATSPLITMPRAKNGMAWTEMPLKTVAAVARSVRGR